MINQRRYIFYLGNIFRPFIINVIVVEFIYGTLGDRYLKPYVIPEPEVVFVSQEKEDECLILASDGLWDVMTNEEACDLARRRILQWHKKNVDVPLNERRAAQDASEYLTRMALQRGSSDNVSVIVVDLKAQRKFKKKT